MLVLVHTRLLRSTILDVSNGNLQPLYLMVLMIMYGLAFLPNMYLLQYAFTGSATGYVIIAFYNLLTGMHSTGVWLLLCDTHCFVTVMRYNLCGCKPVNCCYLLSRLSTYYQL